MGGNVVVKGKQAEKIDLKFIGVENFRVDFKNLFIELSKLFKKETGVQLWSKEHLESAEVFNGSTSFIMDKDYEVDDILTYKPKSGDIDIITPYQQGPAMVTFLKGLEGKEIIKGITYRGSNRENPDKPGGQINCIFDYETKGVTIGVQIDFELIKGDDDTWKRFSHSSSFEDVKKGIKGYSHKMLLRAVHYSVSLEKDVLLVTPKADCHNWEKKLKKNQPGKVNILKFSVDYGVSAAYEPLLDCEGDPIQKDGLYIWKEISNKDRRHHETNLSNVFMRLFGKEPTGKELKQMWSYVGLLDLIRTYLDKKVQADTFDRLFNLFWSKVIGQEIERDDANVDAAAKVPSMELFLSYFPSFVKEFEKRQPIINKYYANYGKRYGSSLLEMYKHMKMNDSQCYLY